MFKRAYELPTKGERGNRQNPLEPLLSEGPRTDFVTIEYFDKDTKVKIVAFGTEKAHFEAYSKGKRLPDEQIPASVIRRISDKSGRIIDSIKSEDIGKYEDFKTGGVKIKSIAKEA